ncbi:MAG: hypothetical protein HXY22_07760 [Alphaproteobacteria bacterium]|nr:hypothetical protein [Alphaproteobacteria bacterium]
MEDENEFQTEHNLADAFASSARPTLSVDVALYQSYLDDTDLSEAQKDEFLRALWAVVVSFVELGFEVHPLQQVGGKGEVEIAPYAETCLNTGSKAKQIEHEGVRSLQLDGMDVK